MQDMNTAAAAAAAAAAEENATIVAPSEKKLTPMETVVQAATTLVNDRQLAFIAAASGDGAELSIKIKSGDITSRISGFSQDARSLKDILDTAKTIRVAQKNSAGNASSTAIADYASPEARKALIARLDEMGM